MSLFPDRGPAPLPPGVDLRCCDVAELLADPALAGTAALVHADPPWSYNNHQEGAASSHYGGLRCGAIAAHLAASRAVAAADARLVVWSTWPLDEEWLDTLAAARAAGRWPWRYLSGGSWVKLGGSPGIGYHWLGEDEPVRLYGAGSPPTDRGEPAPSAAIAVDEVGAAHQPRGRHSEKPIPWMRSWLRRWTAPGDLVVDLYAGLAPLADACILEGRRYVGAELDPERHAAACGLIATGQRRRRAGVLS